jgi:biotin transporter BioY
MSDKLFERGLGFLIGFPIALIILGIAAKMCWYAFRIGWDLF